MPNPKNFQVNRILADSQQSLKTVNYISQLICPFSSLADS